MPDALKIKEIIEILAPHFDTTDKYLSAEHDVIYFPCFDKNLKPELLAKLEVLGAHWSTDVGCWAVFV